MPYAAADASSSTSIPKRRRPRPQSSPLATMAADPLTAGRLSCKHGWMDPGRYPSSLGGASCTSRSALWSRPSPPPPRRRRRRGSCLHQARAPPHPTDRKGVIHCKFSRKFKCSSSGRLKGYLKLGQSK
ncbi:hypothetical protein VPH35_021196 [Triticum aestivum]